VSEVVIVDAGGANVASVRYALERLGVSPVLSAEPERIRRAGHVILPGVGAAADAMQRLRAAGLERVIPALRQPVLGICLGMQLLYAASAEGDTECLGVLPGRAVRFTPAPDRPVPHMGWNRIEFSAGAGLLNGIAPGAHLYFVHSYALPPGPDTRATCDYGGAFTALVGRANFHGVQFHPERSAAAGARLLANFLALGG
jgi:glutamine amidotransferase